MRRFWQSLQLREQRLIQLATVVLLLLGVYALLLEPMYSEVRRLDESVMQQEKTLAWMRQAASEVKALRGQHDATPAFPREQSLMGLVGSTAKTHSIDTALKRMTPAGEDVNLVLESVRFEPFLRWLSELVVTHDVRIRSLSVERLGGDGLVEARVVVGGAV